MAPDEREQVAQNAQPASNLDDAASSPGHRTQPNRSPDDQLEAQDGQRCEQSAPESSPNQASPSAVTAAAFKHPMLSLSAEEGSQLAASFAHSDCDDEASSPESEPELGAVRGQPTRKADSPMVLEESSPSSRASQRSQQQQQTGLEIDESGRGNGGQTLNIELRFLVRRREAGALIGKRGSNIKRLRDTFRTSTFSIPDTGNGPERVVCITTNERSMDAILSDLSQLLMEKSPEKDEQIELKLLIHSSHAGSIIGIGGQSIKKLRNDSKAAIKIYEMCCPLSNERVCAIKAKPPIVVSTIKLIQSILNENSPKGTVKPYDALHFDLNLVEKYGGYLHEDALELMGGHHHHHHHLHHHYEPMAFPPRPLHEYPSKHYSVWRPGAGEFHETCNGSQDANGAGLAQPAAMEMNAHAGRPQKQPGVFGGGGLAEPSSPAKRMDPSASGCDEQMQQQQAASQLAKLATYPAAVRSLGRFHPYAPMASHSFEPCAPCSQRPALARHPAAGACSRFQYRAPAAGGGQQQLQLLHRHDQYVRMPPAGNVFPNPAERCRHVSRPCLCMLMPHSSALSPGAPYVQLVKSSFNGYQRSSSHGTYKK